jgi:hypothetical protein
MYQFIVAGASGGYVSLSNAGKGIVIISNYYLYQGQTLEILVGQPGTAAYQNVGSGGSSGGGGTFVSLNGNLLFAAGGGGGTGWTSTTENSSPYTNAVLTPNANPGAPVTSALNAPGAGGIGGNGGTGVNSAGGGGGYYGSGSGSNYGLSYIAGGTGGSGVSQGGFGGGGSASPVSFGSNAGGGGGYSGGGSGGNSTTLGSAGGGGGSYDINGYNNVATLYTGAIPYNYPYSNTYYANIINITAATAPNTITVSSTLNLYIGEPVLTAGTTFGSIASATTYYVSSILNSSNIYFATAQTLATNLTVTTATGSMTGTCSSFTTGGNVGYNCGAGFVYINMINTNTSNLANYQLQTVPKGIIQNSLLKQEILYPLDTLNAISRGAACGIYSLRLLTSTYTGPLVQLRRDIDGAILDFYGNYGGNLVTLKGQQVQSWASGANAYVVKWYDQSGCGNHATQYTSTIQPILNYTLGQVDFKLSRYLNLPVGTVPAVNSGYTVIARHNTIGYNIPSGNIAGILNSGTQTITTNTALANTMNSWTVSTAGLYQDNWATTLSSASGWYSSNNVVSFLYNNTNRQIYINGASNLSTILASSGHASTTANNAIGASGGGYLNGELYNLCIFNIALLDSERNIIEKIPYGNILSSYSADPYYNDVNLLLHCDSVNTYTSSTVNANLIDASVYKQKVVNLNVSGNMRVNSTYNNFLTSSSIYFDGTATNYINITDGIGFANTFSVTYTNGPNAATGGEKSAPLLINGNNYFIHAFTNVGTSTFTVLNSTLTCDILIVAGGGGGGG